MLHIQRNEFVREKANHIYKYKKPRNKIKELTFPFIHKYI